MSQTLQTNNLPIAVSPDAPAAGRRTPPEEIRWVLWDLDIDQLDVDQHADSILARTLEYGRLSDVRVVLRLYGLERVRRFFREHAHPIISERTRQFWRAFFQADTESWPTPPSWRKSSSAPWIE